MPSLTGKVADDRILIKVGIRAFAPAGSVGDAGAAIDLTYHEFTALVDTGARRTCVSQNVVQRVGLRRIGKIDV